MTDGRRYGLMVCVLAVVMGGQWTWQGEAWGDLIVAIGVGGLVLWMWNPFHWPKQPPSARVLADGTVREGDPCVIPIRDTVPGGPGVGCDARFQRRAPLLRRHVNVRVWRQRRPNDLSKRASYRGRMGNRLLLSRRVL